MKIAVLQARSVIGEIEQNLEVLSSAVSEAAARGADVLVTPELFATGYAPARVYQCDGAGVRAKISTLSERSGIAVLASTVEHVDSQRFITATLFGRDGGRLLHYRKTHLFGDEETEFFTAGSQLSPTVRFGDLTVALGICYDVEFPEYVRALALRGVDLLLVPTAVPTRTASTFDSTTVARVLVPARALENTVGIAYANHDGPGFSGYSCIAAPDGSFAAQADIGTALITADLSRDRIDKARIDNPYLHVRRLDMY